MDATTRAVFSRYRGSGARFTISRTAAGGKGSLILYVLAIVASRWAHGVSIAIYVLVALIWLVPDKRVERALATKG